MRQFLLKKRFLGHQFSKSLVKTSNFRAEPEKQIINFSFVDNLYKKRCFFAPLWRVDRQFYACIEAQHACLVQFKELGESFFYLQLEFFCLQLSFFASSLFRCLLEALSNCKKKPIVSSCKQKLHDTTVSKEASNCKQKSRIAENLPGCKIGDRIVYTATAGGEKLPGTLSPPAPLVCEMSGPMGEDFLHTTGAEAENSAAKFSIKSLPPLYKNWSSIKMAKLPQHHKTAGLWMQCSLMVRPQPDIVFRGLDMEAEHWSLLSTERCRAM